MIRQQSHWFFWPILMYFSTNFLKLTTILKNLFFKKILDNVLFSIGSDPEFFTLGYAIRCKEFFYQKYHQILPFRPHLCKASHERDIKSHGTYIRRNRWKLNDSLFRTTIFEKHMHAYNSKPEKAYNIKPWKEKRLKRIQSENHCLIKKKVAVF